MINYEQTLISALIYHLDKEWEITDEIMNLIDLGI